MYPSNDVARTMDSIVSSLPVLCVFRYKAVILYVILTNGISYDFIVISIVCFLIGLR